MSPFIQGSYIAGLAMAAADDVIIAFSMVRLLKKQKTVMKRYWRLKIGGVLDTFTMLFVSTNSIVSKIITYSVSTGIITRFVFNRHLYMVHLISRQRCANCHSHHRTFPYSILARTCVINHTFVRMSRCWIISSTSHSTYSSTIVRKVPPSRISKSTPFTVYASSLLAM